MAPVARLLVAMVTLAAAWTAHAQDGPVTEDSVKAAFLYKFPGFVEWPPSVLARADEPLVIAVAGSEDVLTELNAIAETRKAGRPLTVKRVKEARDVAGAHVLFIGSRERARVTELIRAAHAAGALTVTEWEGALRQGSVINFVTTSDGRVRFEISLEPAEKSNLKLSSRLLAVAQQVHSTRP
jgi:YfiR/HmsC-like